MACDNLVRVKNILITFRDCDTGEAIGPISHKQANEDLPTIKTCDVSNSELTQGYILQSEGNQMMEFNVIRDRRVPLAFYQGCAAIDVQIEYVNGLVYTALDGNVIDGESSNTHEVVINAIFRDIDELLPSGSLIAA